MESEILEDQVLQVIEKLVSYRDEEKTVITRQLATNYSKEVREIAFEYFLLNRAVARRYLYILGTIGIVGGGGAIAYKGMAGEVLFVGVVLIFLLVSQLFNEMYKNSYRKVLIKSAISVYKRKKEYRSHKPS